MRQRHHLSPRQRPVLEELEPRILYSADLGGGILAPDHWSGQAEVRLLDAAASAAPQTSQNSAEEHRRHELVFVDMRVPDYRKLVDDLADRNDGSRQIEIFLLDPNRDGVAQIGEVLQQRHGIDALHLVSHGADGYVELGSGALDSATLRDQAARIKDWGSALSDAGDLLIYGCDVAARPDGQAMLDALASLTGADVAASNDVTGYAALGGDWDLEYRSGQVDTGVAFGETLRAEWDGLLPIDEEFTGYAGDQQIKSNLERGQTFKHLGGSGSYTVNQISLALRQDQDAPAQNIIVTLRDSWDGNVIGSATLPSSSLGTSLAFTAFQMPDIALDYGTTYTIRISSDAAAGKVYVGYDPSGNYPRGTHLNPSGNPQASQDLAFQVGYNNFTAGLPALAGSATEDQTLSADTGAISDADGLGAYGYQWLRGGAAIAGANAPSYTLGDADVGRAISLRISYTDGQGWDETLTSAPTAAIANVNDAPGGLPAIAGTVSEGQTLSVDTGAIADADGLGAYGYQWLRGGAAIAGANASTYTLGAADVGNAINVRVGYTDGQGSAESLDSVQTATVANGNGNANDDANADANPSANPATFSGLPTTTGSGSGPSPDPVRLAVTAESTEAPVPVAAEFIAAEPVAADRETPAAPHQAPASNDGLIAVGLPPQSASVQSLQLTKPVVADKIRHTAEIAPIELVQGVAYDPSPLRLASLSTGEAGEAASSRSGRELHVGSMPAGEDSRDEIIAYELSVPPAQMLGITLTAGAVWWSLRISGLLAAMLAAVPAWRQLDLLPILPNDDGRERRREPDDSDEALRDENAVGDILAPAASGGRP